MRLSPNTRYAIRILFELSGKAKPVSASYLAEKTGMSLRTVENIHAVLRADSLTSGTVGAKGGISLHVPLHKISLGKLVSLFDNGVEFFACCGDKANECPSRTECGIRNVWKTVSQNVQSHLDAISLDAILQQYPTESRGTMLKKFDPHESV